VRSRSGQPDYAALAEFRYRIRLFLTASEKAARAAGIEPEQYQLLLAVRGMPDGRSATIQALAERLQVRHNTAVERIDRMANLGLLKRLRRKDDRRSVIVELTARGIRVFEKLARQRLHETRESGPELVEALSRVIKAARRLAKKRASGNGRRG
jgi:DNA-binding MarR family transcriptional regulator